MRTFELNNADRTGSTPVASTMPLTKRTLSLFPSAAISMSFFCNSSPFPIKLWYGKTERHKVGVVTYRREVNQMSDCEKAAVYETFLIDLFQVFSERYGTLQKAQAELSEFDQGKYLAYEEFLDAMTTRNEMIAEILSEEE